MSGETTDQLIQVDLTARRGQVNPATFRLHLSAGAPESDFENDIIMSTHGRIRDRIDNQHKMI